VFAFDGALAQQVVEVEGQFAVHRWSLALSGQVFIVSWVGFGQGRPAYTHFETSLDGIDS
jgi:hypothetical protein